MGLFTYLYADPNAPAQRSRIRPLDGATTPTLHFSCFQINDERNLPEGIVKVSGPPQAKLQLWKVPGPAKAEDEWVEHTMPATGEMFFGYERFWIDKTQHEFTKHPRFDACGYFVRSASEISAYPINKSGIIH